MLYTVGQGGIGVSVQPLAGGEPQEEPVFVKFGSHGKHEIAVSPDGARLYLGTYPEILEVVDLDAAGMPLASTLRRFEVGSTPDGSTQSYFRFIHTDRALYRRRLPSAKVNPWPLVVWPLGADGLPDGPPRSYPEWAAQALLVGKDPAGDPGQPRNRAVLLRDQMMPDAVSGQPVRTGCEVAVVPLDRTGYRWTARAARPSTLPCSPSLAAVVVC